MSSLHTLLPEISHYLATVKTLLVSGFLKLHLCEVFHMRISFDHQEDATRQTLLISLSSRQGE